MSILAISISIIVNIFILDFLCGMLSKHTRITSNNKTAGLAAMLFFSLRPASLFLINKNITLKRFFLSAFVSISLIFLCAWLLNNPDNFSAALTPVIIMPFYYFLFALVGHNPMLVGTSIKHFRTRSMLALVIGANIIMIRLSYEPFNLIIALHSIFACLAMSYLFYFAAKPRFLPNFYNLEREDLDCIQNSFLYYVILLLDFLYTSILLYFTFRPLINYDNQDFYIILIFLILFYLVIFMLTKILVVSKIIIKPNFYEERLVPLSFLFFGLSYIYQIYF